jgi:hypothetical protein
MFLPGLVSSCAFRRGGACVAAAICLAAALTPASALAQAGSTVINSYNGTGLTLRAYITNILKQNKLVDGVVNAPHQNFGADSSPKCNSAA